MNRIANVLTRQLGMIPGNRVLLRAPNTPMMVAAYLAVIKAGGIAVATMPLLRARELGAIIDKARISAGAVRSPPAGRSAAAAQRDGLRIVAMGGTAADDLLALMAQRSGHTSPPATRARTMSA